MHCGFFRNGFSSAAFFRMESLRKVALVFTVVVVIQQAFSFSLPQSNQLLASWEPQIGVNTMLPLNSLTDLFHPLPGVHLGFTTPYLKNWVAFAEADYAYWPAQSSPMGVHVLRTMAGVQPQFQSVTWLSPRLGIGYHYLKGDRELRAEETYEYVEDGESEVAWHLGFSMAPDFHARKKSPDPMGSLIARAMGMARHLCLQGGVDIVSTLPHASWIGVLSMGYRL